MRYEPGSWLMKSKLPIRSYLNQITINEKTTNSFIAEYSDQYIIDISAISGFEILAVD